MLGFMFFIFLAIGVIFLIKIKVTNKGIALFEKVMTAVLSAFIFSALVVYSIGMPIIVALIFSFPIFLSIGGFVSFFLDVYLRKLNFNCSFYIFISGLLLYTFISFLLLCLFLFVQFFFVLFINIFFFIIYIIFYILFFFCRYLNIFLFNVFIISMIPALFFYHISLLFKAILKKEVTLIKDQ